MSIQMRLYSPYGSFCATCHEPVFRQNQLMEFCVNDHAQIIGYGLTLDQAASRRFAKECELKLVAASAVKGRGGWENPEEVTDQYLAISLVEHLEKGDMRDIVNFAMFLHERKADCAALFKQILAPMHKPVPEGGRG